MKRLMIIIIILTLCQITMGQSGYSARSIGMAGAYHGMARGAEVCWWNPANLAFHDPLMRGSLDIGNIGISIGNNSFNAKLYNDYFSEDYFNSHDIWDNAAKNAILNPIPSDGFRGFYRSQAAILGFSYRYVAVSINMFSYADVRLPQEAFETALYGVGTDLQNYGGIEGEIIAGGDISLSLAKVLHEWEYTDFFALGITFRYLHGRSYAKLLAAEGSVLSNTEEIDIDGSYSAVYAFPDDNQGEYGDGVGLDLGAVSIINDKLTMGLSVNNIVGVINFENMEGKDGTYSFYEEGLNIDKLDDLADYLDSLSITTEDSFYAHGKYTLPKSFTISGNYRLAENVILELDYHQGISKGAGSSTTPMLALGSEMRPLPFLLLRCGIALGGAQVSTFAVGFGLNFKYYQLDFGIAGQRGLFNYSKGINIGISQRICFD